MELHSTFTNNFQKFVNNFLYDIAENFNIDYEELIKFSNEIDLSGNKLDKQTCMHTFIRGINKGKLCPSKAITNGFCSKHINNSSIVIGNILEKQPVKRTKTMTKTQQDIINWLNTAVPQEETILKRCSKGLFNEDTEFIFDEEFIAIGKLNNNKIVKLNDFDVEICEKRGWKYDEKSVELELE